MTYLLCDTPLWRQTFGSVLVRTLSARRAQPGGTQRTAWRQRRPVDARCYQPGSDRRHDPTPWRYVAWCCFAKQVKHVKIMTIPTPIFTFMPVLQYKSVMKTTWLMQLFRRLALTHPHWELIIIWRWKRHAVGTHPRDIRDWVAVTVASQGDVLTFLDIGSLWRT